MVLIPVLCPHCQSDQVIKGGTTKAGTLNLLQSVRGSLPLPLIQNGA